MARRGQIIEAFKNSNALNPSANKTPFGAAIRGNMLSQSWYVNIWNYWTEFVTPESETSWYTTQPTQGSFDFSLADVIVTHCSTYSKGMRVNGLIWLDPDFGPPAWVQSGSTDASTSTSIIEAHVTGMVNHFTAVDDWVIVNEPLDYNTTAIPQLRNPTHPFNVYLGMDYIRTAYQKARDLRPTANLILNEWGFEHDTPHDKNKLIALEQLVRDLLSIGTPLNTIGIQAHLSPHLPINYEGLRWFGGRMKELGLKIMVTEMDFLDASLYIQQFFSGVPTGAALESYNLRRDIRVKECAANFLGALYESNAPTHITTWSLMAGVNWIDNQPGFFGRSDGLPNRPSIIDGNGNSYIVWDAIDDRRRRKEI